MWFRATLNFRKFKVALNPMYRIFQTLPEVASYLVYQNSVIRKKFTVPFLKYKRLKLKLKVFLAGHSVAMVTQYGTKITPTCSPVIWQVFDTMVVASLYRVVYTKRVKESVEISCISFTIFEALVSQNIDF